METIGTIFLPLKYVCQILSTQLSNPVPEHCFKGVVYTTLQSEVQSRCQDFSQQMRDV